MAVINDEKEHLEAFWEFGARLCADTEKWIRVVRIEISLIHCNVKWGTQPFFTPG
jgi:hypothetical protein